jgi:hypothetical protein
MDKSLSKYRVKPPVTLPIVRPDACVCNDTVAQAGVAFRSAHVPELASRFDVQLAG